MNKETNNTNELDSITAKDIKIKVSNLYLDGDEWFIPFKVWGVDYPTEAYVHMIKGKRGAIYRPLRAEIIQFCLDEVSMTHDEMFKEAVIKKQVIKNNMFPDTC